MHPIVIIGAGSSGLTSIKSCLEENMQVVCFEKTNYIGGIWRYREEVMEGLAVVMKSTMLNSSKEMTAFSDFPQRPEAPTYMHNRFMNGYLEEYAAKFKLCQHIKFEHEVLSVRKSDDHLLTGNWIVTCQVKDGGRIDQLARAVIVGSGLYGFPKWPTYEGQSEFRGRKMHVHSYRHTLGFEDMTVLVVGIGNSGGDVAAELSHVCKKVYLSSRRGTWIIPRLTTNGNPIDTQFIRRHVEWFLGMLPWKLKNSITEYTINRSCDHRVYNLKPDNRVYEQRPLVNDEIPIRLVSGVLEMKTDIHRFTDAGVRFLGEEEVEYSVDAVIFATGYRSIFPFLDLGLGEPSSDRRDEPPEEKKYTDSSKTALYKFVFPVDAVLPTVAFVGNVAPFGSALPIIEMQSRWVASVLSGRKSLPPREEMRRDYEKNRERIRRTFVSSQRHVQHVNYVQYLDDLAEKIDAKPRLDWRMALADPSLFSACVFGPCLPFQYRLVGPHSWQEARRAILTSRQRFERSLQTRHSKDGHGRNFYLDQLMWKLLLFAIPIACIFALNFAGFV